ncbi:Protein of unknown function DUF58 [Haloplanus vescus]|uniref:Uncharacterized protein n=1 Tax=Haloplanus vescus TaxID=555874 RepID=A0A1H3X0F2_9EURY|nr:DUF58 domain-containing protein [Haloplanus vescus]SDZ92857.1 Protein of unknown function DUF58 [Haloplanus vescus]
MFGLRPTRRGLAVLALTGVAVAMSVGFGPRSLDAVILPAAVALVAAGVQLAVLDPPAVERTVPPPGDPGTTGTVSLALTTDTPATATVRDRLPAGLDGDARATVVTGGDPFTYEVTYRERGAHALGPVVVHARDVLGLVRRTFTVDSENTILVYPRVCTLSPAVRERLRALAAPAGHAGRGTFNHLREYTRSDSLRDVHWKSSAKRDDLVVREFADEDDASTVTVTANAAPGHADRMAEAAAAVCVALLDEGVTVALTTPDGHVTVAPGDAADALAHLARVGDGQVEDHDADVTVDAAAETTVRVAGATLRFDPGERRSLADHAPEVVA